MRTRYDLKGKTYLELETKLENCDTGAAPYRDIGSDMTTIISPTLALSPCHNRERGGQLVTRMGVGELVRSDFLSQFRVRGSR
jgi:hypothetical protein